MLTSEGESWPSLISTMLDSGEGLLFLEGDKTVDDVVVVDAVVVALLVVLLLRFQKSDSRLLPRKCCER